MITRIYSDLSSGKSIQDLLQKYFSNLTYLEILSLSSKINNIINNTTLPTTQKIENIVLEIETLNMKNNKCKSKMTLENYGNFQCVKNNLLF
jgi:hypothetical protein